MQNTVKNIVKKNSKYLLDYNKKYYKKNREKILESLKKNQKYILEYRKKYLKDNPWIKHYQSSRDRCLNPTATKYKSYGGRGIKLSMTQSDFKNLWFRDKAYLMKKPNIHRIDNNGHYELINCKFIEASEHVSLHKKKKR